MRNAITVVFGNTAEGPSVSRVWPLFGPQAGGTLVTVIGSELTDSQQPLIVFVSPDLEHFITLSTQPSDWYSNISFV